MRREGWESRLAAVIDAAWHRPYVLGENDCLRLACASVEALTGVDYWPRFAGYKTKRQYRHVICKVAATYGDAVTKTIGVSPAPARAAQRGDLVMYRNHLDEECLGVCVGARVALLGPDELLQLPLTDAGMLASWRIA